MSNGFVFQLLVEIRPSPPRRVTSEPWKLALANKVEQCLILYEYKFETERGMLVVGRKFDYLLQKLDSSQ